MQEKGKEKKNKLFLTFPNRSIYCPKRLLHDKGRCFKHRCTERPLNVNKAMPHSHKTLKASKGEKATKEEI